MISTIMIITFKHCRWSGCNRLTSSVVYENVGLMVMYVAEPAGTKLAELGH